MLDWVHAWKFSAIYFEIVNIADYEFFLLASSLNLLSLKVTQSKFALKKDTMAKWLSIERGGLFVFVGGWPTPVKFH